MFHRNALRTGAWVALLALAWSLLAPLAAQARAADLDHALSLAVCSAGGLQAPIDDAPPPGMHLGGPACAYCHTGPAALPASPGPGLGLPRAQGALLLAPRPEPGAPSSGTWPPLPARGPPPSA